jgi:branched-subunit amino acid aminotransferase/4-amino-4-deoxychorismate lyase
MEAAPFDDRGLTLGDGLFETVLAKQGRLASFDAHAARLARGCAALGLPAPGAARLRSAAETAIAAAGLAGARAAVRLTWTAGSGGRGLERPAAPEPRLIAAAAASPAPVGSVSLVLASIRRNPSSPTSRLKTLAYLDNVLARREAVAAGADEAVMLNTMGELACAAAANLFWVSEGRLFTPALRCGVLDGIVRAEALRQAALTGVTVIEAHEGPEALAAADAVFITNSLIGVRPAARFGARAYAPNGLVERLAQACAGIA